ncbi:MAG: YgjV family protein [Oscillospiraceae bacterium]|nr:YgjV family protein [Oscillospiraceae bacterium]
MENTIWYVILVQGIGFIGILSTFLAYQCKRYSHIIGLRTLNEFVFTVQYVFLGAYTGAAVGVFGCVRNLLFLRCHQKGRSTKGWQWIFSILFTAASVLTWTGLESILTIIAKLASTLSYGSTSPRLIRMVTLCSSSCWLIYNFYVASAAGVLAEVITLASVIIGILRLDLLRKS